MLAMMVLVCEQRVSVSQQSKPFCEQHVPDDKNYTLSKNTFFPDDIVFLHWMGFYFITIFHVESANCLNSSAARAHSL